jgi:plastocyanin
MRVRAARLGTLAALVLFSALASTAAGANASVEIAGFAFSPSSVTVIAGETVTWTNRDSAQHSAAFANGGPRTRALSKDQTASLQFTTAGTFSYVCGIHGASMSGTVIVVAAASTPVPTPRPTVAPTAPPTVEPTPTPSPAPTASAAPTSAAPSATAAPTVAVVVPPQQAPAPGSSNDGSGPNALLIGGAVIALIAVAAAALTRIRR